MKKNIVLFFAGTFFLLLVIIKVITWIYISGDNSKSFATVKQEYLELFPEFLRSSITLAISAIFLSLIAAWCFWQIKKNTQKQNTKKNLTVAISIALLLAFWHLWSLM